ncbi:hypothetical protein TVAG_054360 [Trichomonas vaginalis G3]|uniref:Uncharacterized protein n=1 Tax=Trichomonas vaginalis (strain ATCC PRA-98 / G3) TaxID=412133 RepID=A2EYB1_TRIV3|nr:hypothetical protein TVAGG3_0774390 [Trichomonas vaginalis G3]EAY02338.1 hypothetical protein TVAG_054360 [Trichomonas vaginalis G3]KAI5514058.1 hypothetical protein TVAGG3_0774390 [Trichomonas vaginalis G3]|eukprot:XP_001314653.1 hypothetical protein [Trichomonas vaginalis G3]
MSGAYSTSFDHKAGISFKYSPVKIAKNADDKAIQFNIYILNNGTCDASFLTIGNIQVDINPNSQSDICIFSHNMPKKVDHQSSSNDVTMFAVKYPDSLDYSSVITDFNGPAALIAKFTSRSSVRFNIYDSTDPDMINNCESQSFKIIDENRLIEQNYSGSINSNCQHNPKDNINFIIFWTSVGFVVVIIITVTIICRRYRKQKPQNTESMLSAEPPQKYTNYPQYIPPISEVQNQYYGKPTLNDLQNFNMKYTTQPVIDQDPTPNPYSNANIVY